MSVQERKEENAAGRGCGGEEEEGGGLSQGVPQEQDFSAQQTEEEGENCNL